MTRDRDNSGNGSDHSASAARGPYFFPPLALQRRTFCVEVLKKEGIKSMVELGCGEGSLLGLLTQPAPHLDDFPPIIPPPPISLSTSPNVSDPSDFNPLGPLQSAGQGLMATELTCGDATPDTTRTSTSGSDVSDETSDIVDEAELYHILRRVPAPALYETQLHLRKICGLDLLEDRLKLAAHSTAPPSPESRTWMFGPPTRWEPLTVELWHGSLIHFNENFEDMECIMMSEVIEHLPPDVFDKFIPIVFAAYNARVIVITTPNHDFNRYFDPASAQSADHRFPDPTGRTSRVFRDDDHKFEWTEDEFKDWCDHISQRYDFDVEITGCGSYVNYFGGFSMNNSSQDSDSDSKKASVKESPQVPPPANPDRFFATQCAIFRKRYPNEAERKTRSLKRSELTFHPPSKLVDRPRVFQTHIHPVSPYAARPARPSVILKEVRDIFCSSSRTSVDLRELWFGYKRIAELSGGRVIVLISALVKARLEWDLEIDESRRGLEAVVVNWKLPVPSAPKENAWEEDSVNLTPSPEPSNGSWQGENNIASVDELVDGITDLGGWDDLEEIQDSKPAALNSTGW